MLFIFLPQYKIARLLFYGSILISAMICIMPVGLSIIKGENVMSQIYDSVIIMAMCILLTHIMMLYMIISIDQKIIKELTWQLLPN